MQLTHNMRKVSACIAAIIQYSQDSVLEPPGYRYLYAVPRLDLQGDLCCRGLASHDVSLTVTTSTLLSAARNNFL